MQLSKPLIAAIVFAVALIGLAWWWRAAQPVQQNSATALKVSPTLSESQSAASVSTQKIDSVEVMVERLRARLEKEPNDVDGWVLLGRSYHYLQRWDDAKAAFAKAHELGYRDNSEANVDAAANQNSAATESSSADEVFNAIGHVGSAQSNNASPGAQQ